ncbi:MAG: hypothetical protein HDR77_11760 [Bacteroides sp.]|nr:hypothetical protein [Bacteroides sp.]
MPGKSRADRAKYNRTLSVSEEDILSSTISSPPRKILKTAIDKILYDKDFKNTIDPARSETYLRYLLSL